MKSKYSDPDNKNYDEMFCTNLVRFREQRGLTQYDMANLADIPRSSYRNYEIGAFSPTIPTLRKLAKVLNVDFNELLGGYTSNREVYEKLEEIKSDIALILVKCQQEE